MKRLVRTAMLSAAVVLSGTIAFAAANSAAPVRTDPIAFVVTDRPVVEARVATSTPTSTVLLPPSVAPASAAATVTPGRDAEDDEREVVTPAIRDTDDDATESEPKPGATSVSPPTPESEPEPESESEAESDSELKSESELNSDPELKTEFELNPGFKFRYESGSATSSDRPEHSDSEED